MNRGIGGECFIANRIELLHIVPLGVVAGREGFEPPEVLPSTVFKTAAFDRSAISRQSVQSFWRRHPDSNWGIRALQAHALPLGYVAFWCPKPDLNRHDVSIEGF